MALALRIGVSTPCGTLLTWGTTVFVTGFWICRCIQGFMMQGWDLILPGWRWRLPYRPQFGVSTPWGAVSTQGTTAFVPGLLGL